MRLSIIIPTFNNIKHLKFLLNSLKKNSKFLHEIILHINDGSDGTLAYIKENNLLFTHSHYNIGLCSSVNNAAKLSTTKYILYVHDDMYFCKNWDFFLKNEIELYAHNNFYISGTNVSVNNGIINYDCGSSIENFDKHKFDTFCEKDSSVDIQGSSWAPHLIHKDLWNKIGGFSEEFNPGDASDPDLCMKLWTENVRIFKCLAKFKVYHFSSVTTRKKNIVLNKGTNKFLLKYGFNPRFFRKYYLQGHLEKKFDGPLPEVKITFKMLFSLLINKFKFIYIKFFN